MQDTPDDLLFSATLTPRRMLSIKGRWLLGGMLLLLAALPALSVITNAPGVLAGCMVLDAIGIFALLRFSNQLGKTREQVSLQADRLEIVQVNARGIATARRFSPYLARLVVVRDFDERTTALRLRGGDADVELGAFLTADEKSSFAKVFGTALRKARNSAVKTGS